MHTSRQTLARLDRSDQIGSCPAAPTCPLANGPNCMFIGRSDKVVALLEMVNKVAPTLAPVLITGESGTGKEILAREIHARSPRRGQSFVALNCGAVADTLQESELFGHVRGAFTGAAQRKHGRFEVADKGTLFLDEIAETSPSFQVKLLRILQDGEYAPVGEAENRRCDVRIIAATNQNLGAALESRSFRSDLYYRLNTIRVHVPPLRERKDDIALLADHFIEHYSRQYGNARPEVAPGFYRLLSEYDYPGNVRELANYVHRAVVMAAGAPLTDKLLSVCVEDEPWPTPSNGRSQAMPRPDVSESGPRGDSAASEQMRACFRDAKQRLIAEFERAYLAAVMAECGGIISRAAQRAGLSERSFHQKIKQYGLNGADFRARGPSVE